MSSSTTRWEHGSDFHWPARVEPNTTVWPWLDQEQMWGSARDALAGLMTHLRNQGFGHNIWIPSYFCQEVPVSLKARGFDVETYPDNPTFDSPQLEAARLLPGDAVLLVNFFGVRDGTQACAVAAKAAGAIVIEDHSHDPLSEWALDSKADWCVASLRKTLPIPDGAALWSPARHALPENRPLTPRGERASAFRLAAMILKTLYLQGAETDKSAFRELYSQSEGMLARDEPTAAAPWTRQIVRVLPAATWRETRRRNHDVLLHMLEGLVRVLSRPRVASQCPFSCVLAFDEPRWREKVRSGLLAANIYPAVLWPLDEPVSNGASIEDVKLSRTTLSIHCDMRYDREHMERVGETITNLLRDP